MRAPVHDLHPSHLLTYASLACGVLAIAAAHGNGASAPHLAGAFVAAAALSDTLDGRFARRLPRTPRDSAIGGHLDSLVDACVFGMAPIAILAAVAPPPEGLLFTAWWLAAVVYGVCAVTRLASFNVADDARTFVGVPTPAAALVWSTVLAAGATPAVTMAVFAALGLAMVMPVAIPRPRGAALMLFGAWAVGLVGWHLRGL